jgi:hypothetical protein
VGKSFYTKISRDQSRLSLYTFYIPYLNDSSPCITKGKPVGEGHKQCRAILTHFVNRHSLFSRETEQIVYKDILPTNQH